MKTHNEKESYLKSKYRSGKLKFYIKKALIELVKETRKEGGDYAFSSVQFEKYTGISRQTIFKYKEFINQILSTLNVIAKNDKISTANKLKINCLSRNVEKLKNENFQLKKTTIALTDMCLKKGILLTEILNSSSDSKNMCPICQQEINEHIYQV